MSWVTNALVQQIAASLFRSVLVMLATWLATKGFIAGANVDMFVGAGLAALTSVWGMVNKVTPK